MERFEYTSAGQLEEAVRAMDGDGGTPVRLLAGGTDLLTLLKADLDRPSSLLDIKRIPGLTGIEEDGAGGFRIGALTSLSTIEQDPRVMNRFPALSTAASLAATPQLRNRATIAGNLLQRPRCWYFRHPDIACWLKGGETCPAEDGENQLHAIFANGPCVAVHPSDLAPVLVALKAEVEWQGSDGVHRQPLEELFQQPEPARRTENVLPRGAVVTAVRIPAASGERSMAFQKAMERQTWAFALASVTVVCEGTAENITAARVVMGGVAPVPIRVEKAEVVLAGGAISDGRVDEAASALVEDARPLSKNGYKVPMLRALFHDAVAECFPGSLS